MTAAQRTTGTNTQSNGTLYLVPTPLDFGCDVQSPLTATLPDTVIQRASTINHWICENAKSLRHFLGRVRDIHPLQTAIQQQNIQQLPRASHKKGDHHATQTADKALLLPALNGHDMGLACEAGIPAVADPGSSVVRLAHQLGITVTPLVGPSALIMALAASGLNGQHFAFVGYLPQKQAERIARIRQLEQLAIKHQQAQLCIETPYRNQALLADLLGILQNNTRLSVNAGITLDNAYQFSATIADWKQLPSTQQNTLEMAMKMPCVFAWGS